MCLLMLRADVVMETSNKNSILRTLFSSLVEKRLILVLQSHVFELDDLGGLFTWK